jgi:hypothetical protein
MTAASAPPAPRPRRSCAPGLRRSRSCRRRDRRHRAGCSWNGGTGSGSCGRPRLAADQRIDLALLRLLVEVDAHPCRRLDVQDRPLHHALEAAGGRGVRVAVDLEAIEFGVEIVGDGIGQLAHVDAAGLHHLSSSISGMLQRRHDGSALCSRAGADAPVGCAFHHYVAYSNAVPFLAHPCWRGERGKRAIIF